MAAVVTALKRKMSIKNFSMESQHQLYEPDQNTAHSNEQLSAPSVMRQKMPPDRER